MVYATIDTNGIATWDTPHDADLACAGGAIYAGAFASDDDADAQLNHLVVTSTVPA